MLALLALAVIQPKGFPLTVESIMRGPALVGQAPRNLRWSADGRELGFLWAKTDGTPDPALKPYTVKLDGSGLAPGSLKPASEGPVWEGGSRQGDEIAYETGGDLYLYRTTAKETVRLTETPERESSPRLAEDGRSVVFSKEQNLFRLDIEAKTTRQLTDLRAEPPKEGELANGKGVIIAVPAGYRRGPLAASPKGTHASYDLTTIVTGGRNAQVPNYMARSGFAELLQTYPKVGSPQAQSKTVVVNLASGQSMELVPPRTGRISGLRWSPDGKSAVAWAYAEDNKDAWLLGFDASTDKATVAWTEHDNAWVGGPLRGMLGWLPDSSRVYFGSEKNGFANLMTVRPNGDDPKNLTEGNFEVSDVRMDAERRRFVFVSSEGSPFKRHVASVGFDGGPRTKLAELSADEDAAYSIAPNGKDIAVVRSTANRPAELFVNDVKVTNTPTEEWLKGPWIDPPIVMIPARDGAQVPARLYKPKNWRRGGPAVIFVHGAGYLQNIYDGWSHYYREYMFHHVLMDKGYIVLDLDFRASAGYGKAWRTAIYRHMGGVDLNDNVDGAKWLIKEHGVAPDRLGIYGGSYGGFITFMAMFTSPDTFAAGAALRPVGDWANYHHGYTAPILNTPETDKEAYQRSSPINFVEGFKGSLLICHGMVDVNVQFQDSVKIVQRLIELGKTNWWVAPYPVEDHTFTKASSWTDEYRRILELFENTIGKNRRR